MLSFGRKANELMNKFFQKKNKKELKDEFLKWAMVQEAKHEKLKKDKLDTELKKKNDKKETPLSKRERTKINKELRTQERLKAALLKKTEKEVIPEVVKIRIKKQKIDREKAIVIEGYEFQVHDTVRLKDGNAKGTIEKIEKNIATINYGQINAKSNVNQLELVKRASKK